MEHSCQIRSIYQLCNVRGKKLLEMFPQYSKAQIYVHAQKALHGEPLFDKRKRNKGRPSKLSSQDKRRIIRTIPKLRKSDGSFTSQHLQLESDVSQVSNRTFCRYQNVIGYKYLQSRKKGLLTEADLKAQLKYCRNIKKRNLGQVFWNRGISFYLGGVGFEFKTNPLDQARTPTAHEWRKGNEGLDINCVSRGKKGRRNANFMVVVLWERSSFCQAIFRDHGWPYVRQNNKRRI
jgi:hypothetical protein